MAFGYEAQSVLFSLLASDRTPVSLLESKSQFEVVTRLVDTKKSLSRLWSTGHSKFEESAHDLYLYVLHALMGHRIGQVEKNVRREWRDGQPIGITAVTFVLGQNVARSFCISFQGPVWPAAAAVHVHASIAWYVRDLLNWACCWALPTSLAEGLIAFTSLLRPFLETSKSTNAQNNLEPLNFFLYFFLSYYPQVIGSL